MVPSFLVKSPVSRYYAFRIVVPQSIRSTIGKREIRRSLKTECFKTAQIRAWQMAEQWQALFERYSMSEFEKQIKIQGLQIGGVKVDSFEVDPNNAEEEKKLMEATVAELTKAAKEIQPVAQVSASVPSVAYSNNETTFSQVLEDYVEIRTSKGAWNDGTKKECLQICKKALEQIGNLPINAITRRVAIKYANHLQKLKKSNGEKLAAATVNKRLGVLSSAFREAIIAQTTTLNPFQELQVKSTVRANKKRDAFTLKEMRILFDAHTYKIDLRKPERFWVPLIMTYAACRPAEAAQLTIDNIFDIEEVPCLHFDDSMRLKTANAERTVPIHSELIRIGFLRFVKKRRTEIKRSTKDRRLFPGLTEGLEKQAGPVSNWWNRKDRSGYQRSKCGIERNGVSLYSLRHRAITQMDLSSLHNSEHIAAIVGHEKKTLAGQVYVKTVDGKKVESIYDEYENRQKLQPLIDCIESIDNEDATANLKW